MTKEELKLVLDALKWCHGGEPCGTKEAIAVVERALAQTQEPLAWEAPQGHGIKRFISQSLYEKFSPEIRKWYKPYKCPSCEADLTQRTWVGLTNDELTDLFYNTNLGQQSAVAQAIALLKERNT